MENIGIAPHLHTDVLSAVRAQGVVLGSVTEVADLEVLLAMVAIGDAVTFLPRRTADLITPLTSMVWRAVEDLDVTLSDFVMWRAKDNDKPVVRTLVDSAAECADLLNARAQF